LRSDVHAARVADVLVGTHGAGLTNAFFMLRGASLVEVRPEGCPTDERMLIASLIKCAPKVV